MPKTEKCGRTLVVERYGGGYRYYCPDCDLRWPRIGTPHASWTNANPPKDRRCKKEAQ